MDFPSLKLSVVGGRPFSRGGDQLFREKLLKQRLAFDFRCGIASSCLFVQIDFFSWKQIFVCYRSRNAEETIDSLYRKKLQFH